MQKQRIYFMGIGGTGMASVAGLLCELGHTISGSDQGLYPPMSTLLEELKIPVYESYSPENIKDFKPERIVVANSLSRGHAEIEYCLDNDLELTSFPALIEDLLLPQRRSVVVCGTHGKTTTSSMLAYSLSQLGLEPSFIIGGIPRNFKRSFHAGTGTYIVLEGDEYDTAFFDKGPKFLHYAPEYLIINNIEFDHADIYKNLDEIVARFSQVIDLVADKSKIIAHYDDPNIQKLIADKGLTSAITWVATHQPSPNAAISLQSCRVLTENPNQWQIKLNSTVLGELELTLNQPGQHNVANFLHTLGALHTMAKHQEIATPSQEDLQAIANSFLGAERRLQLLSDQHGVLIYEDFAHHPTAVAHVIDTLKKQYPDHRVLVAFEPRNATSRRNIFQSRYAEVFRRADRTYLGVCPLDQRIESANRMDTKALCQDIGEAAFCFDSNETLLNHLLTDLKSGDVVVFMSSGSFSGIQHQISHQVKNAIS